MLINFEENVQCVKYIGIQTSDLVSVVDFRNLTMLSKEIAALVLATGAGGAAMYVYLQTKRTTQSIDSHEDSFEPGKPLPCLTQHPAVYLDWNATTPIFPEVTQAMLPFAKSCFGNPSSDNVFSDPCRKAINTARRQAADLLGVQPEEIIFTGSGTESDNTAIALALQCCKKPEKRFGRTKTVPQHVVTTNIEHPAIENYLQAQEASGNITVTRVKVNNEGIVSVLDVEDAIRDSTVLVTVMHSNNEIGSLQPISEIALLCKKRGILCHTDAAQSCGKVNVNVSSTPVDMMTVVGHKFGCPKGVSFLYVRNGCLEESNRVPPSTLGRSGIYLLGGGQERGCRGSTENVLLIAALGKACEIARKELDKTRKHMSNLRGLLVRRLEYHNKGRCQFLINGPKNEEHRLPNTLSISIKGVQSGKLLSQLRDKLAASAGSACHTGGGVSKVLEACNVPQEFIHGTLRLSVGRHTTKEDVDRAALLITKAACELLA
eukprot:m.145240 g.145240  ORF g.145240 m.145240 type:complete len:490 (+) comp14942_c0_seq5:196-1665(+)